MSVSVPQGATWKSAAPQPAPRSLLVARSNRKVETFGFRLVMVYLLLEFGRPQEFSSVVAALRLPGVTTLLLLVALAMSGRLIPALRRSRAFIFLIVLMGIHVPFAVNNYWALLNTVVLLQTFVAFLGILVFVDTDAKLRVAARIWVAIHAFLAIHVVMNKGQGVGGWIGDENDVAMTLDMVVPVALIMAMERVNKGKERWLMGGTLLLVAIALPLTMSRGGLLGLVAVVAYCIARTPRKLMSIAVVLVFGVLLTAYSPAGYWEKMETILWGAKDDDSGAGRIYEWKVGWKMFLDSPIIGVGAGNFPFRFAEFEGDMRWYTRSLAGRAAHSAYLTLLPELGLVGVWIVGSMVVVGCRGLFLVRRLARRSSDQATRDARRFAIAFSFALEGALVGYLVSSAFISSLYYPSLWVLLGFMDVLKQQAIDREASEARSRAAATA